VKRVALIPLFAVLFSLMPSPGFTLGPPETLTETWDLGTLDGRSEVLDAPFPLEYVGVSWRSGDEPEVRFLRQDGWTPWREAEEEYLMRDEREFSSLLAGGRAERFQLRGRAAGVRVIALNATDGSRRVRWGRPPEAKASHVEFPGVIARQDWGADERLRFSGGRQRTRPALAPVRKLIIHHTATPRWAPAGGAVRAIYRYHTLFRRWGDIAYHYLIAADGRVFKGRYTGPAGTRAQDRPFADRGWGRGVSGSHTLGANQGTVGIALLGNYQRQPLSAAARDSLVGLLAWLSDRYGIDPRGRSAYQGPWGTSVTRNIAGHRAYGPTECPGDAVARDLPGIRGAVARLLRAPGPPDADEHPPSISAVWKSRVGREGVLLRWKTDKPARTVVRFRAAGREWRRSVLAGRRTRHAVRLRPLRPGTSYTFKLGAADVRGRWRWSPPDSFRTKG
jgi:hypothetical protein